MNTKSKATLEKLEKELRFRGYAERSIEIYVHYAKMFLSNFDKDIYHISVSEAESFLKDYKYSSKSKQNQIISAVKHLYKLIVGRKLKTFNIQRPKKQKKLPRVIDSSKINDVINNIENIKHKTMMAILYECALRRSELINLKLSNIDRKRNLLLIENAKGGKDRYVRISDDLIELIIRYYREYKPEVYLFNGKSKNDLRYSASSLNNKVKDFFGDDFSCHTLRHSGTTAMHEQGTDIATLSKLLGHNSIKTTQIYTHVSNKALQNIKSPLTLNNKT